MKWKEQVPKHLINNDQAAVAISSSSSPSMTLLNSSNPLTSTESSLGLNKKRLIEIMLNFLDECHRGSHLGGGTSIGDFGMSLSAQDTEIKGTKLIK